ncbi:hypothetical protein PCAR4_660014 [Paraburkholderia caribensis]|nr:hypothetical protein PCAR4_660014 [Paraburkholderia caribensis]
MRVHVASRAARTDLYPADELRHMNCVSPFTLTVSQRPLTELLDRDYPAVESGTIAGVRTRAVPHLCRIRQPNS